MDEFEYARTYLPILAMYNSEMLRHGQPTAPIILPETLLKILHQ